MIIIVFSGYGIPSPWCTSTAICSGYGAQQLLIPELSGMSLASSPHRQTPGLLVCVCACVRACLCAHLHVTFLCCTYVYMEFLPCFFYQSSVMVIEIIMIGDIFKVCVHVRVHVCLYAQVTLCDFTYFQKF